MSRSDSYVFIVCLFLLLHLSAFQFCTHHIEVLAFLPSHRYRWNLRRTPPSSWLPGYSLLYVDRTWGITVNHTPSPSRTWTAEVSFLPHAGLCFYSSEAASCVLVCKCANKMWLTENVFTQRRLSRCRPADVGFVWERCCLLLFDWHLSCFIRFALAHKNTSRTQTRNTMT